MLGLKQNLPETAQKLINLKPLYKVKFNGSAFPKFLISFEGFWDKHQKMICLEETGVKSLYLTKLRSRFEQYIAVLYEKSGAVLKEALIERERLNDQIYLLKKQLTTAEEILFANSNELTQESSQTKRNVASAKKSVETIESELTDTVLALKDIKLQLEEALHEIEELIIQKQNIALRQQSAYLKGARLLEVTDEFIKDTTESQKKFDQFINKDFNYCIDLEKIIGRNEKEGNNNEYVQ